jgi:hypothetical protein
MNLDFCKKVARKERSCRQCGVLIVKGATYWNPTHRFKNNAYCSEKCCHEGEVWA